MTIYLLLFMFLQHHCRNCGQVFCNKCSSKQSIIPQFGIEREVRVCDTCFDKLNKYDANTLQDTCLCLGHILLLLFLLLGYPELLALPLAKTTVNFLLSISTVPSRSRSR